MQQTEEEFHYVREGRRGLSFFLTHDLSSFASLWCAEPEKGEKKGGISPPENEYHRRGWEEKKKKVEGKRKSFPSPPWRSPEGELRHNRRDPLTNCTNTLDEHVAISLGHCLDSNEL